MDGAIMTMQLMNALDEGNAPGRRNVSASRLLGFGL